jgi:DNA-binding Lrp family transcriptional regulator
MFDEAVAVGVTTNTSGRAETTTTRGERVRAAARTLRRPRSATWVAEETGTSVKTARKYLDQLVDDGVLQRVEGDAGPRYCVDRLMATYREVATLQREHDREELTDALASMRTSIADWKAEFDVETPGELRATIADLDDPEEIDRRREVAGDWEHLADRVSVVRTALNEYDLVGDRDSMPV